MKLVIEEVQNQDEYEVPSFSKTRLVFLTMVKNESRIIERCIRSVIDLVDAFVICDTGSTDDTTGIAKRVIEETQKPYGICDHEWRNFGHNRTLSFQACKEFVGLKLGWDLTKTYCVLLDADMVLRWTDTFKPDEDLKGAGYSLIQKAGTLHYYNARLLRLSDEWRCVGVTHEYWGGPGTENIGVGKIWIDDLNDGGCKSDKFVRDARLLEDDLKVDSNNGRTWFYLAQTYKDLGRVDESIKAYEKRIEIGGWVEEVWYSMYMLCKLYLRKNDIPMAEMWAGKAMAYHGCRAEVAYVMTQYLREHSKHWKAWSYYQAGKSLPLPNDVLFLETEVYNGLFTYEASILHYYLFPQLRHEGLKFCLDVLNGPLEHIRGNVWDNMVFYVEPLGGQTQLKLDWSDNRWKPSSVATVNKDNWLQIQNVRYVNYECSLRGEYRSRDSDGIVRTENMVRVNGKTSGEFLRDELNLPQFDTHIRGLEDIRLWLRKDGKIDFTASAMDRVPEKIYRIIKGKYDFERNRLINGKVLVPPQESSCEKNWLQVSDDSYIYSWSPFTVCRDDGTVVSKIESKNLPWIFSKFRGSAVPVRIGNELLAVVHSVHYHTVRQYFHYLVALDPETFAPKKWSLPFTFTGARIEYCLGFEGLDNEKVGFLVSIHDADPVRLDVLLDRFRWETLQA